MHVVLNLIQMDLELFRIYLEKENWDDGHFVNIFWNISMFESITVGLNILKIMISVKKVN